MNKIKICHICWLSMGGAETFLCNLLENTDFEKYEITVVSHGANLSGVIISRLKEIPLTIVYNPFTGLRYYRFLFRLFREKHFDVCHSHIDRMSYRTLLLAYLCDIPIRVSHVHTSSETKFKRKNIRLIRHVIYIMLTRKMICICANRYLACSKEAAEYLFTASIIRKQKYTVIPNGINLEKFSNPCLTKHEPTEILFAGRFAPEKNPVFAVDVFSEYLKKDPTAHMTMIGTGRLDKDVSVEIDKLGLSKHIDRIPETADMPKYYRAADLLLFPSLYEGLGMVLIEAQASGLKCLASDTVPRLSQCGLVDYRSLADGPEAWAEYISQLLQNDSLKIDQEKLQFFDIKNTVRMIDEVYGLQPKPTLVHEGTEN